MGNAYPGPFKCPDCGAWWAGFYHKCQAKPKITTGTVTSWELRCTCPELKPGDVYVGDILCPIHSTQVTYT